MNKVEYVCKKCGSRDFCFSLSERRNTIFEIEDGIVRKRDTAYPDDGETNYFKCSKCYTDLDEYDFDEIVSIAQDLL